MLDKVTRRLRQSKTAWTAKPFSWRIFAFGAPMVMFCLSQFFVRMDVGFPVICLGAMAVMLVVCAREKAIFLELLHHPLLRIHYYRWGQTVLFPFMLIILLFTNLGFKFYSDRQSDLTAKLIFFSVVLTLALLGSDRFVRALHGVARIKSDQSNT